MARHYSATKHIYTLNEDVSLHLFRSSAARKKFQEASQEKMKLSLTFRICRRTINGIFCIIFSLGKKNE